MSLKIDLHGYELDNVDSYTVAAALRGPDAELYSSIESGTTPVSIIKSCTAYLIRWAVLGGSVASAYSSPYRPIMDGFLNLSPEYIEKCVGSHYLGHIQEAMKIVVRRGFLDVDCALAIAKVQRHMGWEMHNWKTRNSVSSHRTTHQNTD